MNLIIGITGSLTNGNPDAVDYINLGTEIEINGKVYRNDCVDENGEKIPFIGMYTQPDYGDSLHTFICSNTNPSQITVVWIGKNTGEIVYEHTFDIN